MDSISFERGSLPKLNITGDIFDYLSAVIADSQYLAFGNPRGFNAERLRLEDVWIPPRVCVLSHGQTSMTAPPEEQEILKKKSSLQVDYALNMEMFKKCVVVAGPGYGKTTLCRRLVGLKAVQASNDNIGWIPVHISLKEVNPYKNLTGIRDLLNLSPLVSERPQVTDFLCDASTRGHLWFFFDGLDEVNQNILPELKRWLEAFITASPNRVTVTCRVGDYTNEEPRRQLRGVPVLELSGFSEDDFDAYIEQWHEAAAENKQYKVRQNIAKTRALIDSHKELKTLVEIPLLAAIVVQARLKGSLGRTALLRDAIDCILIEREKRDKSEDEHFDQIDNRTLKDLASHIAFDMHVAADNSTEEGNRGWSMSDLEEYTRKYFKKEVEHRRILDMDDRHVTELTLLYIDRLVGTSSAGLLQQSRTECYQFAHRSLQSYLAARWLATYEYPKREVLALRSSWAEVYMCIAGIAQMTGKGKTEMLVMCDYLLNQAKPESGSQGEPKVSEEAAVGACLACEMLSEFGIDGAKHYGLTSALSGEYRDNSKGFAGLWPAATKIVFEISRLIDLPLALRMRALCAVSRIRDPRFFAPDGKRIVAQVHMVEVPGGDGRVGTDEPLPMQEQKQVPSNPSLDVSVAPFQISRFPVMNCEYLEFINAGGYEESKWWIGNEATLWQQQDPNFLKTLVALWDNQKEDNFVKEFGEPEFARYAEDHAARIARRIMERRRPLYWDDQRFNLLTAPVVGVNLWEAQAFCRWLHHKMVQDGLIDSEDVVRLPSEIEWEWTASRGWDAGDNNNPIEVECNDTFCHIRTFNDSGAPEIVRFGSIPVGFYGLNNSSKAKQNSAEDMAGNVWEWIDSVSCPWTDYPKITNLEGLEKRIVRGSSWYSREKYASHSSFRLDDPPCNAYWDLGFRIVIQKVNTGIDSQESPGTFSTG